MREGKSLRAILLFLVASIPLLSTRPCAAQLSPICDPALFLEPNHFSIAAENQERLLWLEIGYGKNIFQIGQTYIGLEGLAWSRMQMLSGFRFPVQTIDYFFGAYVMWPVPRGDWRLRISHISSHLVDGTDTTIVGGASSRYSREFMEVRREGYWGDDLYWSLGARGYFHQVTKIENWFDIPACVAWRILYVPSMHINEYIFASSGAGPVWPCFSAGVRMEHKQPMLAPLDLELYYQYGASWAGTDAGAKRSTINLQMDVRGF